MLKNGSGRFGSGFGLGRNSDGAGEASTALVPVFDVPSFTTKEEEDRYEAARVKVCERLMEMVDVVAASGDTDPGFTSSSSRDALKRAVHQIIDADGGFALTLPDRERLANEVAADVDGYGPLEPLLADDDVSEIMVNTCDVIFIEKRGQILETNVKFRDEASLLRCCQRMAGRVQRQVNTKTPMCDARLLDGSRINIVIPPVAVDGCILTIRKFKKDKLKLSDLVNLGALTEQAAEVIRIIGKSAVNVLISGGTGSGKTTLLNCVTGSIDPRERIITCEDTAELQLQQKHVVRIETRPRSSEGTAEVTMTDVVKNCLRMKPNRIIVGEVRGPEAVDLVQAMNTGHAGSMGTIHANDPRGAVSRVEALMRTAPGYQSQTSFNLRRDISDALDIIIQTEQLPSGKRVITSITEVLRMEGEVIQLQELFTYDFAEGRLKAALLTKPHFYEKAARMGEGHNLLEAMRRAEQVAA